MLHGKENGADVESGRYDEAAGGVLFIDGLEDLQPPAQRLLLTDIQSGRYLPAGSTRPDHWTFGM